MNLGRFITGKITQVRAYVMNGLLSIMCIDIGEVYANQVNTYVEDLIKCMVGLLPGGYSHWHGIRLCACLLGPFFADFGIPIGGFHLDEGIQFT